MNVKNSFIKLRDKLKKYNKEYYNSNPSIDDSMYDDLKKKYDEINYSSIEVNSAIQKIISFPFYLMLMTILSSTIMMNIKQNRTKIFHLIFGILISWLTEIEGM